MTPYIWKHAECDDGQATTLVDALLKQSGIAEQRP